MNRIFDEYRRTGKLDGSMSSGNMHYSQAPPSAFASYAAPSAEAQARYVRMQQRARRAADVDEAVGLRVIVGVVTVVMFAIFAMAGVTISRRKAAWRNDIASSAPTNRAEQEQQQKQQQRTRLIDREG
ncbi:hypothetical protein DQ04_12061010 [Trypanosoma grayi]|uniref:hypothetical protein n=1 Tax=Trypanosoma grayi TaxID=71804 RepID=UPI0004F48FB4|nr:hypothetical protein DQ04_12061010 [Trypanosoma grayi]KEG06821.1 hypothetical protein DQ04_12061010 [Trypanosoma grayi]